MEGQLFTWEALSAMGGASLLTFFIVQYTKILVDRVAPKLPTDLYAVIVATIVLVLSQLALGADGLDWRIYVLSIANGFIIAAAAGQMQRKAIDAPGEKVVANDKVNSDR